MKLWKILLATMIALVLVCAVAMAEEKTEEVCPHIPSDWTVKSYPTCTEGSVDVRYYCTREGCEWSKVVWQTKTNDNALGHDWTVLPGTVDSTCSAEGSKTVKCLRCEKVEVRTIAKKDHTFVKSNQLSVAPTCTDVGYNWFKCSVCQETKTEEVKALGHSFTVTVAGEPANCHADGHTSYLACANAGCKATSGYNVIPANDQHTAAAEVADLYVAPTCLATGTKYFYCADCGARWTQTVNKIPHPTQEVAAKAATCTEDGYTAHLACKTKGCDYTYGKTVIPASGNAHEWAAYGGKKAATCTEGGWEKTEICKNCGVVNYIGKTEKLGHEYTLKLDEKQPTCAVKGYTVMQCNRCDSKKQYDIDMLAHNYVDNGEFGWKTQKAPSCYSTGVEYRQCTVCRAQETRIIPAIDHKMTKDPVATKPATCTKDGEGIKYCTNPGCDYEVTVTIKATNHPDKKDVVVAAATCTLPGMKHVWCPDCAAYIESNIIIPATNHKDAKITVTKAATCTTEGERVVDCPACGKKTEKIAKLPHEYKWVTVTPASPAGNGRDEYKCACGDVKEVKTVKYTKWYYNNTMTSFGPTTKELVGGSDWYRVTPVDLAVDGVYTYDLIASNKYVVGTVTITVNAGTLTVSYNAKGVEITDEALLIYASKADLATGTAVTAPVGAAINAAETFGADTKVLVSLILTGNYDAAGKGLIDASAAAGMIANID